MNEQTVRRKIRNATSDSHRIISSLILGRFIDPESSGITVSYFVKTFRAFARVSGLFSPSVNHGLFTVNRSNGDLDKKENLSMIMSGGEL
jgi:hypothetical protein